jgi:hypothetical protein
MIRVIVSHLRCYQCTAIAMLLMALLVCLPGDCAQITETIAADLATAAARKIQGIPNQYFMAATRDIVLENEFSACLSKSSSIAPYIYRTTNVGKVVNGDSVTSYLSLPAQLNMVVAVSDSGVVFKINGTIDSKREIEKLALHHGISLTSAEAARTFFKFYMAVNPENRFPTILVSVDEVCERAKTKLQKKFGDNAGESLFKEWWQHHRNDISKLEYCPQIVDTKRGRFLATFYSLSDISSAHLQKGPAVLRVSLELSSRGIVSGLKFHPVWR